MRHLYFICFIKFVELFDLCYKLKFNNFILKCDSDCDNYLVREGHVTPLLIWFIKLFDL